MPVTTSSTRSPSPAGRRLRRSPTASSPTSSPTAPGGSTTPASSSGRRASSASTRARPSGAPAPTGTPSRRSRQRRSAPWSTPTTTATTRSATACSPAPRSSGTSGRARRSSRSGRRASCRSGTTASGATSPLDPPFLTFTDSVTVHAGDLRAELRHVGTAAHTTNDSIVWLPERSVLFCGDLVFNGGTPFLLMGSVSGAIEVLEDVVAPLGAETVVPGHGAVFSGDEPIRRHARLPALRARRRRAGARRPGSARWTRPATPTSAGSPTGPTPSASSATCTAPTPSWTAPRAAARSTSSPRSATWSPTTAARPLTCLA